MIHTVKTKKGTYRCTLHPWNVLLQAQYIRVERQNKFLFFKWYTYLEDSALTNDEVEYIYNTERAFKEVAEGVVQYVESVESCALLSLKERKPVLGEPPLDPNLERARIYREAREDHERMGL